MSTYGIDIVEVEQSSAGTTVTVEDVWNTARAVWSRVLMDVMDSYIYAAAVEIEADVFMTSDGSLLEALANLRNPSGDWVSLTRSLKRCFGYACKCITTSSHEASAITTVG